MAEIFKNYLHNKVKRNGGRWNLKAIFGVCLLNCVIYKLTWDVEIERQFRFLLI